MTARARIVALATAATVGVALAGCATQPATGSSAASPATTASATPSPSYPFTPAATPTVLPSGWDSKKESTGGPTLAPTAGGPLNGKIIFVDPGHSGAYDPDLNSSRVDSPWGPFMCVSTGTDSLPAVKPAITEHALNWAVAQKTSDALRAEGATVILSRASDDSHGPCNIDRAKAANAAKADYFLSIHADGQAPNSIQNDPTGFHVQTETRMAGGQALYARSMTDAQIMVDAVQTVGQQPLTNYVPRKPAGIWQRDKELTVLGGLTNTPGVLVEMGNMKNPKDLARINDPATQDLYAKAFVKGIEDALLKPASPSASPESSASDSASATPASASATTVASPSPTQK